MAVFHYSYLLFLGHLFTLKESLLKREEKRREKERKEGRRGEERKEEKREKRKQEGKKKTIFPLIHALKQNGVKMKSSLSVQVLVLRLSLNTSK